MDKRDEFPPNYYNANMSQNTQIEGKLLAIHWPLNDSDATLAVNTSKPQQVTAEIEDSSGITHRIEVSAHWDADFLVGKEVMTQNSEDGMTIALVG